MSAARPYKRLKKTHYHDRIPLEDDIEVIHARSSRLTSRNITAETAQSPLKGRTTWSLGSTWAPEDDQELALDDSGDWYDEEIQGEVYESGPSRIQDPPKKKYRRSGVSVRPHVFWKNQHRAEYLDEDIRREGRGDFKDAECPDCVSRKRVPVCPPEYRCTDCFLPDLSCKACCVKRHQRLPFHCIERWNGIFFVKVSLKSIGLEIHLNHASMRCPAPIPCHQDFRIIHTNGIHDASISYCGCHRTIPRHLQLLRRGLYPASQITAQTCVTFSLLRLLHIVSLTSKASTYDLYRALEKLTDNVGTKEHRSRYRPLLRIGLQWRHLKLLKRGGRGHDPAGVDATKEGELAIRCPSCPHPGINLPDGWKDAPEDKRFLYRLLVCMDANFHLKNQLVSNYSTDPGLGTGWAYMVKREPYEKYILSQTEEEDISTCVGLQALAQALTRFSRGLRYTGVGGVFCGRGEMILPGGVGNLQKGERYANMDYIFASAIQSSNALFIDISYDIACQWYRNLYVRMNGWPPELRLGAHVKTRPLIPKFHEPAHEEKDHEQFSFNFVVGVGKSDGEVPERVWAGHNGLGGSTKTQGPGSRQDVLDDHFGFWNWQKYCNMGSTLMRRYKAAVAERNRQVEAHRGFTESLPSHMVSVWEEMCAAWDADGYPKSVRNPFATEGMCISEATVKAQLAAEDKERDQRVPALHSTGPSTWLSMGLELEESQRRLRMRVRGQSESPTEPQSQSLAEQRAALTKNIKNWEPLRALYIPGLLQYHTEMGLEGTAWENNPNPEDIDLFLPSQLPAGRQEAACVTGLPNMEAKLRNAQCFDALSNLRRTLRLKTRMIQFKNQNIRGQNQSTRSRALIDRVHQRALAAVEKYRAAREALLSISGPGPWEKTLQPLLNADVRSYVDPERRTNGPGRRGIWEDKPGPSNVDQDGDTNMNDVNDIINVPEPRKRKEATGQTKQMVSWIWRAVGGAEAGSEGEGDDDILRAEWARNRSRVQRCKEEVLLLLEEMRRVLAFLEWRENWWTERQNPRTSITPELQEGLQAYAVSQAALQKGLSEVFQQVWKMPLHVVPSFNADVCDDEDDDEGDDVGDDETDNEGNDGGGEGDCDEGMNGGGGEGNANIDDDVTFDNGGANILGNSNKISGGGNGGVAEFPPPSTLHDVFM